MVAPVRLALSTLLVTASSSLANAQLLAAVPALSINPNLTALCAMAVRTVLPRVASSCHASAIESALSNTQLDLPSAITSALSNICVADCQVAISSFPISLESTCGDQPLVLFDSPGTPFIGLNTSAISPLSAATVGSYLRYFSTVVCVRTATESAFCLSEQAAQLSPSLNATQLTTSRLVAAVSNQPAIICSNCARRQVLALDAGRTYFVDHKLVESTVELAKTAIAACPAVTPSPSPSPGTAGRDAANSDKSAALPRAPRSVAWAAVVCTLASAAWPLM